MKFGDDPKLYVLSISWRRGKVVTYSNWKKKTVKSNFMLVFLYIDSGSGLDGESRCNQEFVEILNLSEAI